MITGRTKICAVIGDPIEHSMSPVMHNAAFREVGLDYVYMACRVRSGELKEGVAGLRALGVRGFNVTIPHKVAIMGLLDKIDAVAEKIGAINTVVNDDGVLTGHNTDAAGFLRALLDHGVEPAQKKTVILGAGGAARAISYILAERGAHLEILNREPELDWAEELARWLSQVFKQKIRARALDEGNLAAALEGAEIMVNATSVGMSPASEESPVGANLLRPGLTVFDAVYSPMETQLLREATVAGAQTIGGIDMLAWQGALAFSLWTGRDAPARMMRDEAVKVMKSREK